MARNPRQPRCGNLAYFFQIKQNFDSTHINDISLSINKEASPTAPAKKKSHILTEVELKKIYPDTKYS